MTIIQAIILAIVEGITEFLPISSTGHMIITSWAMGIASDPFVKMFTVSIQLGAILSVVVLYFKRFIRSFDIYLRLGLAFLPAAIAGLAFKKYIDMLLEDVLVVGVSLLLGGIILLFIDKWFAKNEKGPDREPSYKDGLIIGVIQCISMIPGVSRAAATIVGGLSRGLNRKSAAEFSFLLAVPTMLGATVKSLWDDKELLMDSGNSNIIILLIGNLVAFIVAMLAIRFFIGFLTKYGFRLFGWYRIIMGILIIALVLGNIQLEMF